MDPKDIVWKNDRWEVKPKNTASPKQVFLSAVNRFIILSTYVLFMDTVKPRYNAGRGKKKLRAKIEVAAL